MSNNVHSPTSMDRNKRPSWTSRMPSFNSDNVVITGLCPNLDNSDFRSSVL
uniref:Uncharacterized protein n=1 Tax=Lepeophtheirus salmonis TaxID=72036 RepID=A0A0K2SZA3_LEPSM